MMRIVSLLLVVLLFGQQAIGQQFTYSKIANRVAACNVDFGPDGHLYAVNANVPATQDRQSMLLRYRLDETGAPTNVIDNVYVWGNLTDCVVGMVIDPDSTPDLIYIYISISQDAFIYEWGGRIERITVTPTTVTRDILYYGLPVGFHQINDMFWGPDNKIVIQAGSTTTSGMPGHFSNEWNEKILSAAFLKAEVRSITSPINVQTAGGFNYNPYAADAPMKAWVVSIRNPFDGTFHSNGNYYAGTNQNDVNGDTGDCNGQTQNLKNERPEEFIAIIEPGHTYGFPNPSRSECVLMGGNPTDGVDPFEVTDYRVGITPPDTFDPSLLMNVAVIGGNSPDGILEYQSEGALKHRLIQAYYGYDGYIMTYTLGENGYFASNERLHDTTGADINIRWILDIAEHPIHGHIYGAAYGDQADNGAAGGIWFLQRSDAVPAADLLKSNFYTLKLSTPQEINPANQTIRIWNAGTTGNALAYTLASNVTWMTVPVASGTSSSGALTQRKGHELVFNVGITAPGVYYGAVTATAGQQTFDINVILTITNNTNIVNTAPQVDAGKNVNAAVSTLPYSLTLSGSATDDGLPSGAITFSWVLVGGQNNTAVTIVNPHNASTLVSFTSYGIYQFQLQANDGALVSSSLVTVYLDETGNTAPVITSFRFSRYTIHLGDPVTLYVTATDDGLPNPPAQLSYSWERVETGVGIATFSNPSATSTMVTFSEPSSYLCQCTVSDGTLYVSHQAVVVVVAPNVTITDTTASSTGSTEIDTSSTPTTPSSNDGSDMSCGSAPSTQPSRGTTQEPIGSTNPSVGDRRSDASSLMMGTMGLAVAVLALL